MLDADQGRPALRGGLFQEVLDEAGKAEEPHQIVVPLNGVPSVDQLFELEKRGVTSVIHMPLAYRGHLASSLDEKLASMEEFGEHLMIPIRKR